MKQPNIWRLSGKKTVKTCLRGINASVMPDVITEIQDKEFQKRRVVSWPMTTNMQKRQILPLLLPGIAARASTTASINVTLRQNFSENFDVARKIFRCSATGCAGYRQPAAASAQGLRQLRQLLPDKAQKHSYPAGWRVKK